VTGKLEALVKDKIGERAKDMIHVNIVCTDPESQGHGYASALLDTITRLVSDQLSPSNFTLWALTMR
jgi:GNAT superfamily N-acetyltransferase